MPAAGSQQSGSARVLKQLKRGLLGLAESAGVYALARRSGWRNRRLLILCYHGIARDEEHLWRPALFMERAPFEARMVELSRGYAVLPLAEAITRLYDGTLPPRSVAITVDDGGVGFYREGYPILKRLNLPVTVYLTTHYCEHQFPVFSLMCSYILWKRRGKVRTSDAVTGAPLELDARTEESRQRVADDLVGFAAAERATAEDEHEIAKRLAEVMDVDYGALCDNRILHIMDPSEVSELARAGVDFQLHTHRHRTPQSETLFRRELHDNSRVIERLTGRRPEHFCYPSGDYRPEFVPWLIDEGVRTATTCEPAMASRRSSAHTLPRLVDVSSLAPVEFRGWLAGVSAWLPRRRVTRERVESQNSPGP